MIRPIFVDDDCPTLNFRLAERIEIHTSAAMLVGLTLATIAALINGNLVCFCLKTTRDRRHLHNARPLSD